MKKLFFLILFCLTTIFSYSQSSKVYVGKIEGDIDLGLVPYVKRTISEAENNLAKLIIFEINTFGGRVDAATQLKDAIINSKVKTLAFIDKRAISAGALISLSCEKIVMVPGASIGASTVVDQAGKKQAEKYQSYMRSEMRATAEKNGRPADIAEGMVDERISIEGLVDSTQLITLTTDEAIKYKIADFKLSTIDEVLDSLGIENAEIETLDSNWAEAFIRFLNNPVISSLLIMIGLVGLFTEVKSPGWGVPGTAGVVALILFFGAGYILELASAFEIVLFIVGIALLLVEFFVIPGFGIFGFGGIALIIISLFLGLISDFPVINFAIIEEAIIQLAISLVLSLLIILILWKYLPKTAMFKKLVLDDNIDATSGYTTDEKYQHLMEKEGIAHTDLRPAGTAIFENKKIDVVTEGDYVEKSSNVKVIHIEGSKIVVRKIAD
ncbi:MAG: nodulation protein NfeD [Rhodothermaceae bacterium]